MTATPAAMASARRRRRPEYIEIESVGFISRCQTRSQFGKPLGRADVLPQAGVGLAAQQPALRRRAQERRKGRFFACLHLREERRRHDRYARISVALTRAVADEAVVEREIAARAVRGEWRLAARLDERLGNVVGEGPQSLPPARREDHGLHSSSSRSLASGASAA